MARPPCRSPFRAPDSFSCSDEIPLVSKDGPRPILDNGAEMFQRCDSPSKPACESVEPRNFFRGDFVPLQANSLGTPEGPVVGQPIHLRKGSCRKKRNFFPRTTSSRYSEPGNPQELTQSDRGIVAHSLGSPASDCSPLT